MGAWLKKGHWMIKRILVAAFLTSLATSVYADGDAIQQRQQLLKAIGDGVKPVAGMLKGEAPFDLAAVKSALATISANAKKLPALFPDDSKTGHDTRALPAIWSDKEKFNGLFQKLDTDATAASSAITDLPSLKAEMPKVFADCKSCHDDFRAKK
jgi:cytochrome c556